MCVKNRLKEIRWKKGLSQEQLAIKSGVDKSVINHLEQNENATTDTTKAVKLAKALGTSINKLFPD